MSSAVGALDNSTSAIAAGDSSGRLPEEPVGLVRGSQNLSLEAGELGRCTQSPTWPKDRRAGAQHPLAIAASRIGAYEGA